MSSERLPRPTAGRRLHRARSAGFTLVEVAVTIVIVGIYDAAWLLEIEAVAAA